MNNKIVWEKYYHPLFGDEDSKELDDKFDEPTYKDKYDMDERDIPIMMNPMMGGMIPLPNPYKDFNLWTAYTNFPLTQGMLEEISHVYGVETLQILTPYRMRLGVGKLFQSRDVMVSINNTLNVHSSGKTV